MAGIAVGHEGWDEWTRDEMRSGRNEGWGDDKEQCSDDDDDDGGGQRGIQQSNGREQDGIWGE